MIPYEIDNIKKFKNDFPKYIHELVCKYPFNFKLRKFKTWALANIDKLNFTECNFLESDQIFDASIILWHEEVLIKCPIPINISKLITKVENYPRFIIKTSDLYELVHPDVKDKTLIHISPHKAPPILLQGDCFDCQLIDGNHRTLINYKLGQATTEIVIVNKDNLYNCLAYKDSEIIIELFSKLNCIFKNK